MSYILLVDDEEDILDVLELVVHTVTQKHILKAHSGQEAVEELARSGEPALVISDFTMPRGDGLFLFRELRARHPKVPFILCSANPHDQLKHIFPELEFFVQKPNMLQPLKLHLKSIFPVSEEVPEYVKVPVGYLKRLGVIEFDAFIKLSDEKFLKLHQSGDVLDQGDYARIEVKFLNNLYLEREDALEVVRKFEEFLSSKIHSDPEPSPKASGIDHALQSVALLCKSFGWNAESVQLAKRVVDATLKSIERNKSWQQWVKRPLGEDSYSLHISQLALLTSLVAHNIGWHSESTQEKLIMASLLHDHFVDESAYSSSTTWNRINELKHSGETKSPYLQHPILAAELARKIQGLPVNVDTIIVEHHERPSGTGFPRGLGASRISALSALFIICEALVMYAFSQEGKATSLEAFLSAHPDFEEKDPFRKIVNLLRSSVPV